MRLHVVMLLALHAAAAHAREAHEAPWVVDAPALPPSAVNGLTIDSGGFLWVSDDRSLARFDGKERLALPARRERNSSYVYQIVSLQNGSVYAVPGGSSVLCGHAQDLDDCLAASPGDTGLLKAEHPQGPGPIIATLPGPRIYSASPSRAGGLWLGSTGRVVRMRSDETLSPFAGEVAGTVTALVERSSGGLVIGTSKGLFELAAESAPHGARLLVDVPVHALAADHEQNIWVAGPLGLLQLAPSGARTRIAGLPSEDVRALVVDHEGDVWAGTWDGVARVVRGKVVPLDLGGLPDRRVTSLTTDAVGNVWIGFRTGGVRRATRQVVQNFGAREGLPADAAQAVATTATGDVWAVFANGDLVRWKDGVLTHVTLPVAATSIRQLHPASDGSLWLATSGHGAWRLKDGQWQQAVADHLSNGARVTLIHTDTDGGVWLSADGTLTRNRVDDGARLRLALVDVPAPPAGCAGGFAAATVDAQGSVWLAGPGGSLLAWTKDGWRCHVAAANERGDRPTFGSVAASADGTIWAGAPDGGLARLARGQIRFFSEEDGLPCDAITQVLDDGIGNLWYSCGLGIVRLARATIDAYVADRAGALEALHINRTFGLLNEETSRQASPAAAMGRADDLWVATQAGLARIIDASTIAPVSLPQLSIWNVSVNGRDLAPPRNGTWSATAGAADVTVTVAAPMLAPHESLCFGYQVLPRDGQVKVAGSSSRLDIGNIKPGLHGIAIAMGRTCGQLKPSGQVMRFHLTPPWYGRTVTWIIFALAMPAFALIAYRLRFRFMAARYAALEAERKRIARDLHDGLGQGFTALRYHLGAAEAQAAKHPEAADALKTLSDTRALLHTVEQETRHAVWALRSHDLNVLPLHRTLPRLAATLPADLKAAKPQIVVHCPDRPERLPPLVEAELHQVAREALTNALKHADAKRITIQLEVEDEEVRLMISDDGRGFAPQATSSAHAPEAAGHFGLLGMRERMRRLGGILTMDSAPGEGTTILAVAPRPATAKDQAS